MNIQPARFSYLPEVVKNLLIINGLFFLAKYVLGTNFGINLDQHLALHHWESPDFRPHQLVTHLFMHGSFSHILFNMFALWMFGNQLENIWGGKRFLVYYMITGLGAAVLHLAVIQFQISGLEAQMALEQINRVKSSGYDALQNGQNFIDPLMGKLNLLYYTPTVGASGAVFGLLLAFGMLFPNTLIYLYFAIPIKAKYFVAGYGLIELWLGIQNSASDNVAHFAHLGGMLFGYFLIKYWRKNSQHFY
jgi:membrane associated rhomboid family serine protease